MKIKGKKYYKNLYEIELNNRRVYEKRYLETKSENIELQKETGLADLRKQIMELSDQILNLTEENAFLKEDRAKLYIQREDLMNTHKLIMDDLSKAKAISQEEVKIIENLLEKVKEADDE